MEGYFTTRKPRGTPIRFVAFGDNSYGDPGQRAIAWHAHQARPDFVMNTGDNVYEHGLDSEYIRYFFPIYNADVGSPQTGAPLLRSVPFYTGLPTTTWKAKTRTSIRLPTLRWPPMRWVTTRRCICR